jgi:CRP-like cAMP-binding protein
VSAMPVDALKAIPLFSGVPDRDLTGIARWMARREVAAGESMTHQGKGGIGFFVVESGSADVFVDGNKIRTLGPGDYFGEVALLAESTRTATITSDAGMICWGMRAWNFVTMVKRQPTVAEKLLDGMAHQLAG